MSAVKAMAEALEAALKTVPGVRTYRDPGANIDPPGVVLGPPTLTWEGVCAGPTSARFPIYLVTAADDRTLERLWDLVPLVESAVDGVLDAAVILAAPGSYVTGGTELPSYEITVETSLND